MPGLCFLFGDRGYGCPGYPRYHCIFIIQIQNPRYDCISFVEHFLRMFRTSLLSYSLGFYGEGDQFPLLSQLWEWKRHSAIDIQKRPLLFGLKRSWNGLFVKVASMHFSWKRKMILRRTSWIGTRQISSSRSKALWRDILLVIGQKLEINIKFWHPTIGRRSNARTLCPFIM